MRSPAPPVPPRPPRPRPRLLPLQRPPPFWVPLLLLVLGTRSQPSEAAAPQFTHVQTTLRNAIVAAHVLHTVCLPAVRLALYHPRPCPRPLPLYHVVDCIMLT